LINILAMPTINGLNVFLAPKNLGIHITIIKFESIVMDLRSCGGVGGHFRRHNGFLCYIIDQHHFYDLNVFLAPQNLGIETKIIKFELIVT